MKTNKILRIVILVSTFISLSNTTYAVDIVDTNPPVISLIGSSTVNLHVGDSYTDEGATATDDIDGDITANIVKTGLVDTNSAGTYSINFDVSDNAGNHASTVTRTIVVALLQQTSKENVFIRSGDKVLYSGEIDLPTDGSTDITDNSGIVHQVNNRSVLGVLYALDQMTDSFSLSNLQYFDSFSSFYIKCITPNGSPELCDSWQYVVGGTSPWTSVDSTLLTGGENIALYFGNPYRVSLSSTNITTADTVTAKAESYDYADNTWTNRTGVTIGVTVPNPNDPWNPTVISTHPVDSNGQVILTFPSEGTYIVGVSEDFYFPSYSVTVSKSSGGGGGSTKNSISIQDASSFLSSKQKTDGSFGEMLYTDWAAVAIGALGGQSGNIKQKIYDYLKNNSYQSSNLTDNERHAMALMALGISPYNGTNINYIDKIIKSYDGSQFGEISLYNDDVFALIVLLNAGYSSSDEIIKKDINFILSRQSPDGSWGSPDMTGATLQALYSLTSIPSVSEAIAKAEAYLVSTQGTDGSFSNSFSTSWVLQGLSLNNSLSDNMVKADKYLASQQQTDGGIGEVTDTNENRVWATSYAIPAALHMTWRSIMQSFPKSATNTGDVNNNPVILKEPIIPTVLKTDDIKQIQGDVKPIIKKKKIKKFLPKVLGVNTTAIPLNSNQVGSENKPRKSVFTSFIEAIESPFIWLLMKLGF